MTITKFQFIKQFYNDQFSITVIGHLNLYIEN